MRKSNEVLRTLDAYIEMYLRVKHLDDTRSLPDEKRRANDILNEREKALGITSEQLAHLLDLIDVYETDENAFADVLEYYESVQ